MTQNGNISLIALFRAKEADKKNLAQFRFGTRFCMFETNYRSHDDSPWPTQMVDFKRTESEIGAVGLVIRTGFSYYNHKVGTVASKLTL